MDIRWNWALFRPLATAMLLSAHLSPPETMGLICLVPINRAARSSGIATTGMAVPMTLDLCQQAIAGLCGLDAKGALNLPLAVGQFVYEVISKIISCSREPPLMLGVLVFRALPHAR